MEVAKSGHTRVRLAAERYENGHNGLMIWRCIAYLDNRCIMVCIIGPAPTRTSRIELEIARFKPNEFIILHFFNQIGNL